MTAITLTVVNFNGQPPARMLSASFDELGGAIGRADSNQLVLDDPDRTVSRVHAQIVFRAGQYALIDRGSNPVLVNGREVGSGREARIQAGDTLQIGGYQLRVSAASSASAASADPFADLLGPTASPAAAGGGWVDPLAAFGSEAAAPSRRSSPPAAAPVAVGGIPDDWDPFAEPSPAASSSLAGPASGAFGLEGGAAAPAPLIPDLGSSGSAASIDSLFGLGPSLGGDPLAQGKLDAPLMQPNTGAAADALQALSALPQASATAAPDTLSALNQPFLAPPTAASAAPRPPRAGGAVLSWGDEGGDGRTLIRPAAPRNVPAAAPAATIPVPPAPQRAAPPARPEALPAAWTEPSAAAAQPVSPPPALASPAEAGELLQAFREGLATPGVAIEALSPALMRLLGELLREAAAGTVDLLVARAALKREVKAEATMIVARENNPLKFSPSAEAALQHLLAPPVRGFMAAGPAMRDAYDDLRAHQFGVIAGMRAALEGVLERFDPAQLEGRLVQRSRLANLLPGSRKAQLWELFIEHYTQISQDAAEDFHSLFGKAFLQAYEEHIDRLQRPAP